MSEYLTSPSGKIFRVDAADDGSLTTVEVSAATATAGTGFDLIKDAMQLLGLLASGEDPTADEQADCLRRLNAMWDSWNTEKPTIYQKTSTDFTLVASTQTYTWGTGGTMNGARPVAVEKVTILDGTTEHPLDIVGTVEYADLDKSGSGLPEHVYIDGGTPLRNVKFDKSPDSAYTFRAYTWVKIPSVTDTAATIVLPEGYERATAYNLAIEIAPLFPNSVVRPEVAKIAQDSKANIQRLNYEPAVMACDAALLTPTVPDIERGY